MTLPADMFSAEVYGKAIGFVSCVAYMAAAASPFVMGRLIQTNLVTGKVDYFWAWIWVAGTAATGVVASILLTEKKKPARQAN